MRVMGFDGSVSLTARARAAAAGALALTMIASGGAAMAAESHSFITSDGARLHYLEAGPSSARTVVFVPGWTMPAWIWERQIEALEGRFHVLALDPRGQGRSEVTRFGYTHERRGRDIGELIEHAARRNDNAAPVVLVGWSLGVLDSLAYVAGAGDSLVAGLVLVDNSIGEGPAPVFRGDGRGNPADVEPLPEADRARRRAAFVQSMFAYDPGADYRARLTRDALRMTQADERRLLAYDAPRSHWRLTLHATRRPVLYVVRPRWREQGRILVRTHPDAHMEVFEIAGHALFVDEPERFNRLLIDFLDTRVGGGAAP